MKAHGILHPRLAAVVAAMGHGDELCISDAGLPIPGSVERIDLAFAPGQPPFLDVLDAIAGELRVEAYVIARESPTHCPELVDAIAARLPGAVRSELSHEELKARCAQVRAVVRTGEFTPFANVLLRSGVDFTSGAA